MYISKDRKSDGYSLGSVGPKDDIDAIEQGIDNVLALAGL